MDYYLRGAVKDIQYDTLIESYYADVLGGELYDVEVYVTDAGEIEYGCDCRASFEYPGACKHVIATLLEMESRHIELRPNVVERMSESTLLTQMKSIQRWKQPVLQKKSLLNVEFELSIELGSWSFSHYVHKFLLSMRVGENRLYVVKDMYAFLQAIKESQSFVFTNNFSYHPDHHQFEKNDEAIFDIIYKLLAVEELNTRHTYGHKKTKRHLTVPNVYLHQLIDLLATQDTKLITGSSHLQKKDLVVEPFEKGTELFQFAIVQERDMVLLHSDLTPGVILADDDLRCVIKEDTIYKLTDEQAKTLDIIGSQYEKDEPMDFIPMEQLESFCSEVLPVLPQYGVVTIEDKLQEKIDRKPLQASLKIDYENEELTVHVTFRYGQIVRNPFAENQSAPDQLIIVRDVEKEQRILQTLYVHDYEIRDDKLVLDRMDEILDFLYEELQSLKPYADIFLTSEAKRLLFQPASTPSVSVDVEGESNWLDVNFSIEGISDKEIVDVLRALYSKKKYHRLSSGAFIPLEEDQYQSVSKVVQSLGASVKEFKKSMNVPLHKAFALDEGQAGLKFSKKLHQLMKNVQTPEFSDWTIPSGLDATLRNYQEVGFKWMHTLAKAGLGGILADDMGLGKTLQTITHLQAEHESTTKGTSLVVAPASVIYNWEKELKRFAPHLEVAVIAGARADRDQTRIEASQADVWITSYPLMQRDYEAYEGMVFETLILDEAQAIKNEQAKTTKAIRTVEAKSRFALSGTPIENRLDELFSMVQTILPGLFGTKKQFRERSHEELAKRIRPFLLRRMKKEVLTELPDKMESVQYTDLLPEQKKYYLAQVKQLKEDVDQAIHADQFQKKRIEILAGLTKLRQLCCHPRLVLDDENVESGKLTRLLEYVEEGLSSGQRMVIFSQFTSMLAIMKDEFISRGWDFFYLDGQTAAKDRLSLADQFNSGEKSLFLVSLKAGGTGLNLTGGDTVILYDTWWNPAIEEQAADRVYRFGQTKNVQVIKLIANGTIEEKILALHEKKKALVDAVIQPGEQQISSLSVEEIKELLAF